MKRVVSSGLISIALAACWTLAGTRCQAQFLNKLNQIAGQIRQISGMARQIKDPTKIHFPSLPEPPAPPGLQMPRMPTVQAPAPTGGATQVPGKSPGLEAPATNITPPPSGPEAVPAAPPQMNEQNPSQLTPSDTDDETQPAQDAPSPVEPAPAGPGSPASSSVLPISTPFDGVKDLDGKDVGDLIRRWIVTTARGVQSLPAAQQEALFQQASHFLALLVQGIGHHLDAHDAGGTVVLPDGSAGTSVPPVRVSPSAPPGDRDARIRALFEGIRAKLAP